MSKIVLHIIIVSLHNSSVRISPAINHCHAASHARSASRTRASTCDSTTHHTRTTTPRFHCKVIKAVDLACNVYCQLQNTSSIARPNSRPLDQRRSVPRHQEESRSCRRRVGWWVLHAAQCTHPAHTAPAQGLARPSTSVNRATQSRSSTPAPTQAACLPAGAHPRDAQSRPASKAFGTRYYTTPFVYIRVLYQEARVHCLSRKHPNHSMPTSSASCGSLALSGRSRPSPPVGFGPPQDSPLKPQSFRKRSAYPPCWVSLSGRHSCRGRSASRIG